jgi:hypothetical protein
VQHDVVKSKKLKPMSNLKNVVILVRFFIVLYLGSSQYTLLVGLCLKLYLIYPKPDFVSKQM